MPCNITFKDGGFTVPTGQKFTVNVLPPAGGGLSFLHIVYAGGSPIKAEPYTFEAKEGVQNLHVFYTPTSPDQQGRLFTLVEVCDDANPPLGINNFDFSDPHFAVQIKGV